MRLRRGWPLLIFVVGLVALPILEVWLLIQVGREIGTLPTVLVLIAEALLGSWLLRREGARTWRALTAAFSTGRPPTGELADAALVLVGGVLLILPGFATDVLGLLFLLPWTRPFARKVIAFFVARRISRLAAPDRGRAGGPTVIAGEVVDEPASPRADATIVGEIED